MSSHQVPPYAKLSVEIELKVIAHLKVSNAVKNVSRYYLFKYQKSVLINVFSFRMYVYICSYFW